MATPRQDIPPGELTYEDLIPNLPSLAAKILWHDSPCPIRHFGIISQSRPFSQPTQSLSGGIESTGAPAMSHQMGSTGLSDLKEEFLSCLLRDEGISVQPSTNKP
jgi:hypothetical protein